MADQVNEFDMQIHVVTTTSEGAGPVTASFVAAALSGAYGPVYVRRSGVELQITEAEPIA